MVRSYQREAMQTWIVDPKRVANPPGLPDESELSGPGSITAHAPGVGSIGMEEPDRLLGRLEDNDGAIMCYA
jgi:hypothetical protein